MRQLEGKMESKLVNGMIRVVDGAVGGADGE